MPFVFNTNTASAKVITIWSNNNNWMRLGCMEIDDCREIENGGQVSLVKLLKSMSE